MQFQKSSRSPFLLLSSFLLDSIFERNDSENLGKLLEQFPKPQDIIGNTDDPAICSRIRVYLYLNFVFKSKIGLISTFLSFNFDEFREIEPSIVRLKLFLTKCYGIKFIYLFCMD